MANSLTSLGQDYALKGDGADGALARLATALRLYDSTSVPVWAGTGFVEVANANGYTTGGISIGVADWTLATDSGNRKMTLGNQVWTAAGGSIADILGAYLTDAGGNVLAWWERPSAITIASGDTFTATGLYIKISN
jgi:hypothetical protein